VSSESCRALRLAKLYRRLGCLALPRAERVAIVTQGLTTCEAEQKAAMERVQTWLETEHKPHCSECQTHGFCLKQLRARPEYDLHRDEIVRLREALYAEEYDEKHRQSNG
jgi:hypothetical protein